MSRPPVTIETRRNLVHGCRQMIVKANRQTGARPVIWLCWLILAWAAGRAGAAVATTDVPVITSLSVAGTNLVFTADFPAGVTSAVLEMRPRLSANWQPAATLNVPTNGGPVEFFIPKPDLDSAFFRLNATLLAPPNARLSAELQYVAVPPLGPPITHADQTNEAVFHFTGMVDGSDRIRITHQGAFWEHVNWGWPGTVTVNDSQWVPAEKNYLTSTGAVAFLPAGYSLSSVNLETIQGRDVIALERTNNALIAYLDDTPAGAAPYEFKLHFHPAKPALVAKTESAAAELRVRAEIDGSDVLKITPAGAVWTHHAYAFPRAVRLNDLLWNVRQTNALANAGTNVFLPANLDFSTAKIVRRQGRDLAAMWADKDALWISFADNPNGADHYELDVSFGP
jgi:hypothetical protein